MPWVKPSEVDFLYESAHPCEIRPVFSLGSHGGWSVDFLRQLSVVCIWCFPTQLSVNVHDYPTLESPQISPLSLTSIC